MSTYSSAHAEIKLHFADAYTHCRRWGGDMTSFLGSKEFIAYAEYIKGLPGLTFRKIYEDMYKIRTKGIGPTVVYDIATQLCRDNGIIDERVYLCGNGPKRAARLLNIPTTTINIKGMVLQYTTISHVIAAFDSIGYAYDKQLASSKNGDHFETALCKWQRGKGGKC